MYEYSCKHFSQASQKGLTEIASFSPPGCLSIHGDTCMRGQKEGESETLDKNGMLVSKSSSCWTHHIRRGKAPWTVVVHIHASRSGVPRGVDGASCSTSDISPSWIVIFCRFACRIPASEMASASSR